MTLDIGTWIGLSSLILSAALAFNGYRNTQVTELRRRAQDLEDELKEARREHELCEVELRRVRRDNEWLMGQLRKEGRPL